MAELIDVGGIWKTKCQLCEKPLTYFGGTTSMLNHMKNVHKRVPPFKEKKDGKSQRQTSLLNFNEKKRTMRTDRLNETNRALALVCALDLRPLSLASGVGFKNFCRKLNAQYHIPCRTTIKKYLDLIYEECKEDILSLVEGKDVSLTTDLWTSVGTTSYITVTCHFLSDWHLQAKILATRPLHEKHTGVNIAATIGHLKDEFKINKVTCLVTDNAANMLVAAREAGVPHWSCYSHTLQLAVEDGLKYPAIQKALGHARRIVSHFSGVIK